jgi:hypothetical protein
MFLYIPLGDRVFDFRMIIFQIITLQFAHYITLGLYLLFLDLIMGITPTVEQFFSYKAISIFSRLGWATMISFILNALTGSFLLFIFVQRSQKCLDFTLTVYLIHFFICVFYKAFPIYWEWWVCIALCIISMILLGEYICYRREIREIPLTAQVSSNNDTYTEANDGKKEDTDSVVITVSKDPSKDI